MRRGRRYIAWSFVVLFAAAACGRGRPIWSGVRLSDDGQELIVAAQVGLCGAMTLENVSGVPVGVRATRGEAVVGHTILPAKSRITLNFDWAGDAESDVYFVEATDPAGQIVPFENALRLRGHSPWVDCPHKNSEFAPLYMNSAMSGFVPGETKEIPKPIPDTGGRE